MAFRSSLTALAAATLAVALAGCAMDQEGGPISQRAGRAAAASVPTTGPSTSTVRGGLNLPNAL